MLISLHLPKTAGNSFRKSLEMVYAGRLATDYDDFPIVTSKIERNANAVARCCQYYFRTQNHIECIHGHFLPLKYLFFGKKVNAKFVTWLRDPVERLASHYHFWKRYYNPATAKPLHKKFSDENWSLEKFCFSKEMKNVYSQFLWGFPISKFDFIGVTEFYEVDFNYLCNVILKIELPVLYENVNVDQNNKTYINDNALRSAIEKYHAKDMELYHYALALRKLKR